MVTVADAVAEHVREGDALHLVVGHTRWSAAAREVVRQWWGRDPRFTLVMLSLSSLGALFFRGGLVEKVVTGYSGDTFPNFTPNPWFQRAYAAGEVEVEHWSFLAFSQRLQAAAQGLPAVVTRSIVGSSMEANDAYTRAETPFGEVGLLAPLVPDVAILHAPVADRDGNVAVAPPSLEGVWGALAARRGAIVTVERVVDDLRELSDLVRIPAHRVLAVCEAPMGAHPGGLFARGLPVDGYGEDYEFWVEARAATRDDAYDDWIRHWILEPQTQEEYLERLGPQRVEHLRAQAAPESWRDDEAAYPPDLDAPPNRWEIAATFAARHLADRVHALVGGPGTVAIGCLGGAPVDRHGNVNSTTLVPDGGPFLVGSGGGNDVASVAAENVVATLTPSRTSAECAYVTSPGRTVRALVTDLGRLERLDEDDELVLTAVPEAPEPVALRVERARAACGWNLTVAATVEELPGPSADEIASSRRWDPRGWFLRD